MSKKQHWSLRPDDAQPLTRVKQCLGCAVRVSGSFRSCGTTGISTVQSWRQLLLLLLFYWWYHSNESIWGIIPWVNWVNSQNITSLVEVNMKIKMQKVIKHCLESDFWMIFKKATFWCLRDSAWMFTSEVICHWFQWFSLMLEGRVARCLFLTAQCLVVKCTPPAALFVRERRV